MRHAAGGTGAVADPSGTARRRSVLLMLVRLWAHGAGDGCASVYVYSRFAAPARCDDARGPGLHCSRGGRCTHGPDPRPRLERPTKAQRAARGFRAPAAPPVVHDTVQIVCRTCGAWLHQLLRVPRSRRGAPCGGTVGDGARGQQRTGPATWTSATRGDRKRQCRCGNISDTNIRHCCYDDGTT